MSADAQLDAALDLMRRLPPERIDTSLGELVDLVPPLCEDLLSSIDQPLKIARDPLVGKEYLLCDYNRDGDSYRSPWSNRYDPPLEDGAVPTDRLRRLEEEANQVFEQYKQLYYEGGVSSVYLWELSGNGFAGVVLIKKGGDNSGKIQGSWDSIHVIEVQEKTSGKNAHYKLTSTVMLWLKTMFPDSGTVSLGGSLMRQFEQDMSVSEINPHVVNIGKMIEEAENKIKVSLSEIYFSKTLNVVNGLRCKDGVVDDQKKAEHLAALGKALSSRNNKQQHGQTADSL